MIWNSGATSVIRGRWFRKDSVLVEWFGFPFQISLRGQRGTEPFIWQDELPTSTGDHRISEPSTLHHEWWVVMVLLRFYRVWITSHLQYKFPWGSWDLKIGGLEIQKNPWYTESTPLLFCWFLRLLWTPQLDFVRHFCGWRFPKTKSPPCMGGDFQQRRVLVHSFNPFEKICASQIGSFPQGSGRKFQKILDTTTCHLHSLKLTYIALKIDLWKRRFLETAIFGGELLVSGRVLGCPWYLVNGLLTLL